MDERSIRRMANALVRIFGPSVWRFRRRRHVKAAAVHAIVEEGRPIQAFGINIPDARNRVEPPTRDERIADLWRQVRVMSGSFSSSR